MAIGITPMIRSLFEAHTIDLGAVERAPLFDLPFSNQVKIRGYSAINQPNVQVIIEDFMPGTEFSWVFTHDEFQYALSGHMALEVYLPPLYGEVVRTEIKGGDVYTFPVGARMHVKVIGDKPFRHICFCPPSPNYPFPTLADINK